MKTIKMLSIIMLTLFSIIAKAQHAKIIVGLKNQNILQSIQVSDGYVTPIFTDASLNSAFGNYTIYSMKQTFPASRFPHMHRYYSIECNNINLIADLQNLQNSNLPYAIIEPEAIPLYTPNDYGTNCNGNAKDLDLIRAKDAWDITHGDSNVVIGVTDTRFDENHQDFVGKIDTVRTNNSTNQIHGTIVAGIIAAKTDNSFGISSIGFNCKLDLSDGIGYHNIMLDMSNYGRKILNASWGGCTYVPAFQNMYDEVYENGTITCGAAGNGYQHCNFGKMYPASYDHNISVSSVGSTVPYGQKSWWNGLTDSIYWNQIDVHENVVGVYDTMSDNTIQKIEVHNHNEAVDIVAPGYTVTGLKENNSVSCNDGYGTSFASPLVAGTCGLMLSANNCLSPYQMEYILKNTAHNIYNIPENVQYIGMLGSGRLDAGAAVSMASTYDCNSIFSQTFIIKGIEFNTVCAPGFSSNTILPQLKPILENGQAPYTYKWEADPLDNAAILDAYDIANPTVISSTAPHRLHYRLTVYDNSPIQKVASKNIQIDLIADSTKYDIAMRDTYMDMTDEANSQTLLDPREWNIWESPDIWNRRNKDGGVIHQQPEYFTTDSNFAYVRIRNVGCAASPANKKLKMYWTKASTGEKWEDDWTITDYVNPQTNDTLPAGREITQTPIDIPVLQPGDTVVFNKGWRPVQPSLYDTSLNSVAVCLLARIEEDTISPFGMSTTEVINTSDNVRNNNNIITRNLIVNDFNGGNNKSAFQLTVANVHNQGNTFNFQFINDREINKHISGDVSKVLNVELFLSTLLYNRWKDNGFKGNYLSINHTTKSVKIDPSSTSVLKEIYLNPNESEVINVVFTPKANTNSAIKHTMHFRQFENIDNAPVYGNVTINLEPIAGSFGSNNNEERPSNNNIVKYNNEFLVFPNPANDIINIQYTNELDKYLSIKVVDINGSVLYNSDLKLFNKLQKEKIDISSYSNGIYFVEIKSENGELFHYKFLKQ